MTTTKTTKTAHRKAIKTLPALRTSLIWFKRETLRTLRERAERASSPKIAAFVRAQIARVRAKDLADLRDMYISHRVQEICRYRRSELRVRGTLVFLRAEA